MANEYGYNIVLGGKIDEKTLQTSIQSALKGIKFKIKIDQQSLRDQVQNALKNIKVNVGIGGSGGSGSGGTGGAGSSRDTSSAFSRRITYSGTGEKLGEVAKYVDDASHSLTEYYDANEQVIKSVEEFSQRTAVQAEKSFNRLKGRIDALDKSNIIGKKSLNGFREELERISQLEKPEDRIAEMQKLNQAISDTKKQSMGLMKQITTAMGKFLIWSAVTVSYFALVRKMKDVIVQVKAIDDALVELKKVTDISGEALEQFTDRAFNLGKTVARTGIDTIKAITEIKRAGYDLAESEYLAKYALMMTNVAEGITDAGEAAKIFVSILKGTGKDVSYASTLLDEMNQISNNAAINFDNLASMTQRIAATLNTLGTDVEHTMGLITGAYEVLQDERVAKGLSVIGLRMQGLNEDLEEEAGLQSKVNEALEKYAGISVFDVRTGQLRDYYSILEELAGVWDNISKNAQVYLTTTLAGKNRADVLNALMKNWQGVENAIDQATDSLGSADKEQENYINSISGKLAQLSSAWQDLARTSWESDWSKGLVDMATAMLNVIRYGGGLLPVFAAATSAILAFKAASLGASITFGYLAVAISAYVAYTGKLKQAEAERIAAIEESNQKIQASIDQTKTQYNRYSELRGEVDSLKEEQERLNAIENKTAEQKKQLTQITKQLAAAQKELNQYVGEGAETTEQYSLELLKEMGRKAKEYTSKTYNINAYEQAKWLLSGSKTFGGVEEGWSGWSSDAKNYAKSLGVYIGRTAEGNQSIDVYADTFADAIEALRKLRDYVRDTNKAAAVMLDRWIDSWETSYEAAQKTVAEFEKYAAMAETYGNISGQAIDNLSKAYQRWTKSSTEQKIAMLESNGELTKNLAAVEALKEKYPALGSEIDSITSSIKESIAAFKEQDRYIDEVNKRIGGVAAEKAEWEEAVKARKAEEEYQKLQKDVADAEQELAEAKGEITDKERARLELQLETAKAALKALELADKETEAKKKQLEYEEKVYAVQKAEYELANARNKKVQVFRAGQGMVYISDYSAVEAAQRGLTSARQSLADFTATQGMTARKEAAQAAVDKAQEQLDAYDKMTDKADAVSTAMENLAKATQALADYENEITFTKRTESLQADIDKYNELVLTYGADKVRAWVDANYSKLGTMSTTEFVSQMALGLAKVKDLRNQLFPELYSDSGAAATSATAAALKSAAIKDLRHQLFPELYSGSGAVAGAIQAASVALGGNATTYQIENVNIEEAGELGEVFREIETKTRLVLEEKPIAKP